MVYLSKRRFDVVNQKQIILLVIPPIFLALAAVVVAARWHARQSKRINTLVEDLLCLAGLVSENAPCASGRNADSGRS